MNSRSLLPLPLLTRNLTHTGAMSNNISQGGQEPGCGQRRGLSRGGLEALRGLTGWIISDGKAGNDVQTRGVFDALGLSYQVKPVDPRGLWRVLSPWGPVARPSVSARRRASSSRRGRTSPSPWAPDDALPPHG